MNYVAVFAADPCGALTDPPHGSFDSLSGVTGDVRTLTCGTGYGASGTAWQSTAQIACTAPSWSPAPPVCLPKPCPALSNPPHGAFASLAGATGDSVAFACELGYTRAGAAFVNCTTASTWTAMPSCTGEDALTAACGSFVWLIQVMSPANPCPGLTAPSYGNLSALNGSTGDLINASCDGGRGLIGSALLICTKFGNWSHAVPVCLGTRRDESASWLMPASSPSVFVSACSAQPTCATRS